MANSDRPLKPFQGSCRGDTCGAMIWMVPAKGRGGRMGWKPMDPDPDFPNEPPDGWDPARSHFLTCPDANAFGAKRVE